MQWELYFNGCKHRQVHLEEITPANNRFVESSNSIYKKFTDGNGNTYTPSPTAAVLVKLKLNAIPD